MQPSNNSSEFHPHFSTWLASSEQLERTLVANHEVIRDFLARLQAVEHGSPANHFLLVGPRGIGKTHVMCLAGRYVAGRARKPAAWAGPSEAWLCVLFAEEEYAGQNSLANFLLTFFAKLQEAMPAEPLWQLPKALHDQSDLQLIDCCFERLERCHREKSKRILLLIDNLQKVLQQWSEADHQKLRSFLSRNNLLVIFGSAPSVFREVMDQKAAFHDFFEIRILAELSNDQVLDLLARRFKGDGRQAEYESRKEELARKIPAIAVLTGGNPRLVLFLYEIATRSAFLDIEVALRRLIEELREYFVRRFDELPSQARKVLDTIAQMPGPATPKEIAGEARLSLALVNAQLKRLKEGHFVKPVKFQRKKSTPYDITERLFRIWRQTATVAGRQRFRFLADFLKLYFTPEEVRGLYSQHLDYLRNASGLPREEVIRHIDELYYFQAAIEGEIRYGAFCSRVESLAKLGEMRRAEEEAQYFAAESSKKDDERGMIIACKAQAMIYLHSGRYKDALADVKNLIDKGADQEAGAIAEELLKAGPYSSEEWGFLGITIGNLGQHERALEAFRKAMEMGEPTSQLWTNQALALEYLKRPVEALRCSEQALALDEKNAKAWIWLGVAAGMLGQNEKALEAFHKAMELGQPSCYLWGNQAIALRNLNRPEEALKCWEQAVALDEKDAGAWEQLGITASDLGQHERALEAFRKAMEVGQPTSRLLSNQAFALSNLGRAEEGLSVLDKALALDSENPSIWRSKAWILIDLNRTEEGLACIERARQKGAPPNQYHHDRGKLLLLAGHYSEALQELEQGPITEPSDWDLQVDRLIALGCWGQQGPGMEALPPALAQVQIPPARASVTCQYAHDVALRALGRGEKHIALGLLRTSLEMETWTASDWFGKQLGNFLRQALDTQPQAFVELIQLVRERLRQETALKLLDPFLKAGEFLQSRNVAILERLFPEVRELVWDILKQIDPALGDQIKRLI